jgi:glycogen operon protein
VAWNGGVEGPADDPALTERRAREVKLLLTLLAAAPGTIQLTAGDELGRTQRGNTNAWCQDNEIGWVEWPRHRSPAAAAETSDRSAQALVEYLTELLRLRKRLGTHSAGPSALIEPLRAPGAEPALEPLFLPSFALLRTRGGEGEAWLLAVNAGAESCRFPLPKPPAGRAWRLRLDTARGPGDEVDLGAAPLFADETWQIEVAPRAVRWLVAEPRGDVPA